MRPAAPGEVDRDGVARDAGFRPGQQALLPDQAVDQGRFAGVWAADDGDANRGLFRGGGGRLFLFLAQGGRLGQRRAQRVVEIAQALAVLRADRDRIAEPQRVGLERAGCGGAPLGLIGDQDRGLARPAHQIGEGAIGRIGAGARVDQKKHGVGLRDRRRGLRLHAGG